MQKFLSVLILLTLMLSPFMASAQEGPPPEETTETPKPLPALPVAPYVKEHAEALQAHIDATKAQLDKLDVTLKEKKAAAAEEGITEEEKVARDKAVTDAEEAIQALNGHLSVLNDAIKAAKEGPTQAELDARRKYDAAVNTAEAVLKDLTIAVERNSEDDPPSTLDGDFAKAIRAAEEDQKRIEISAANAESFEFSKSRVYEKLTEFEKLDYELRWALERQQLSINAYDHLNDVVFEAYRAYGARAFKGLEAISLAVEQWKLIEKTPAKSIELPQPAKDVATLKDVKSKIEELYDARAGKLAETMDEMVIINWRGRLQDIQRQIDTREDYKDRLEQDSERLKNILAESGGKSAPETEEDALPASVEPEEYQKLGQQIDDYKQLIVDSKAELERIAAERQEFVKLLARKKEVEKEVELLINETGDTVTTIEEQFARTEPGGSTPEPKNEGIEQYLRKPLIVLFALRERQKAEQERLVSARRDSRQAQTQLDILDRRTERLKERITETQNQLLPETRQRYYEEIGKTAGIRAAKVAGVLLVAWFLLFLIRKVGEPLIDRVVRRADKKQAFSADEQQRARTLMTVFMTTARVVVYITAIMFAIAQFDVDYGPLLVAAGGVSLAVGFGAQTLVKDFFAGFFILLEGQFSIGDVIEINGKTGTVENLNLRTTVIRGLNGDVHTIPNGEISVTTNMTKLWSRAIVDIGVAYEENVDHVGQVIEGVAKEMRESDPWNQKLLDTIYMGVLQLGDSAVVLRMLLKTRAGEQWGAAREFNRRCKLKFDELGIEIPWPQQVHSMKWSDGKDAETIEQATRKKRANLLRYVRRMRGEVTEEEAELAKLSVEERDRAETLAKREVELAQEKGEDKEGTAEETAEERQEEVKKEDQISDAEKLAKKLATEHVKKEGNKQMSDAEAAEGVKTGGDEHDEKPDEDKK